MSLDKKLLAILACPDCKGDLIYKKVKTQESLHCKACKHVFEVKKGIPILLPQNEIA